MKKILKIVLPLITVLTLTYQPLRANENHMREAMDALNQAKAHLKAATPDKGGHRVRAIHLIDNAMDEIKAGIQYDREHESKKEEKKKKKD
ncbi:MAG: hypothetical protein K1X66_00590 [Verrucomicrobiae bacterium]|nr:hypothetical protein [Verrucomicrobiae bacterium]